MMQSRRASVRKQTVSTQSEPKPQDDPVPPEGTATFANALVGADVDGGRRAGGPCAPRSRPIVGKEEPEAASGTDTLDRTFPFPGALPLSLSGRTGPSHANSRLLRRRSIAPRYRQEINQTTASTGAQWLPHKALFISLSPKVIEETT
ncbi:hypothetical protein QQF64_024138 [Cirrhinus molitorella]|uniref:Uncharacterized protein n=1 Tax=Cirrhinus molitorella TaxID=172907 RepID=A0ABR3NLL3_9TELE